MCEATTDEIYDQLKDLHEKVDNIERLLKANAAEINGKLDRFAYKWGLVPFAIAQTVHMKDTVHTWNRHDECVMGYNGDFTKFRNEYDNWKNVNDYE